MIVSCYAATPVSYSDCHHEVGDAVEADQRIQPAAQQCQWRSYATGCRGGEDVHTLQTTAIQVGLGDIILLTLHQLHLDTCNIGIVKV